MRKINIAVYSAPLFLSILLVASTQTLPAHAQAPAAGASVTVRMMEMVDSGKDPAGKQYRASVTKAVDAGNGVTIPAGAVAAVTLAGNGNGSGWTTQLVSVTVKGQAIALTSGPASLTSAGQTAALNALNSVGSMLGGFGHHVKEPSGVAAVATGQRVVLPPGIVLTFVLTQPPAGNPVSQPLTASAAPASSPAPAPAAGYVPAAASIAGAGGSLTEMLICFSNPPPNASDLNHKTEFLTGVFEIPADARPKVPLNTVFEMYLKTAYQYPGAHVTCQPIWSVHDAKAVQKKIATDHAPNVKMVDTGWRYGQPPLVKGQSGFDPLTQGSGGLDLSQHRLTTYYCTLLAKGGTSMIAQPGAPDETLYFSPIFQADWDSDTVSMAFQIYMERDVHDLSRANPSPWCTANSPEFWARMHPGQEEFKLLHHKVPVDFTYTAAQAAASHAAAASENAASLKAAAALGPNQSYAYCYSDPTASVVYFSDIFPASTPPPTRPGRPAAEQAVSAAGVALQGPFQAFLQKKYGVNGSAICHAGISAAALPAAHDQKKTIESNLVSRSRGTQIVETGWKNTP